MEREETAGRLYLSLKAREFIAELFPIHVAHTDTRYHWQIGTLFTMIYLPSISDIETLTGKHLGLYFVILHALKSRTV